MRIQKRNLKLQYTILKRKWISQIVKKKSKTRLNIQLSQFMQTTTNEELISSFHLGITSSLRLNQACLRAVWFYEKGSRCLRYWNFVRLDNLGKHFVCYQTLVRFFFTIENSSSFPCQSLAIHWLPNWWKKLSLTNSGKVWVGRFVTKPNSPYNRAWTMSE